MKSSSNCEQSIQHWLLRIHDIQWEEYIVAEFWLPVSAHSKFFWAGGGVFQNVFPFFSTCYWRGFVESDNHVQTLALPSRCVSDNVILSSVGHFGLILTQRRWGLWPCQSPKLNKKNPQANHSQIRPYVRSKRAQNCLLAFSFKHHGAYCGSESCFSTVASLVLVVCEWSQLFSWMLKIVLEFFQTDVQTL